MCRTFEKRSAKFPEAEKTRSVPGQELLFKEITQDNHCVLIGKNLVFLSARAGNVQKLRGYTNPPTLVGGASWVQW